MNFWELVKTAGTVTWAVLGTLAIFSLASWTIIFSKWSSFRRARNANLRLLRAFRKSTRSGMRSQRPPSSFGPRRSWWFSISVIARCPGRCRLTGMISNKLALERTLQIGMSEEVSRLEQSMSWLATIATVSPFIGLFGTVLGIIDAFQQLAVEGSTSMRTVAPGIAQALIATGVGLAAAIPAAIFYNYFGNAVKEMGARLEDFSLEFLNMSGKEFRGAEIE